MNDRLKLLVERIEHWPDADLKELERAASDIEAEHGSAYRPSPEELEAIDEALAQVDRGDVGTPEEVAAAFASFRRG